MRKYVNVSGMKMLSPAGFNPQLCYDYYGLPLHNIQGVLHLFYSN